MWDVLKGQFALPQVFAVRGAARGSGGAVSRSHSPAFSMARFMAALRDGSALQSCRRPSELLWPVDGVTKERCQGKGTRVRTKFRLSPLWGEDDHHC